MTVDALVLRKQSEEIVEAFPVAGQRSYDTAWLPAARAIGLVWLTQVYSGISADSTDAPILIDELLRLQEYLLQSPPETIVPRYVPEMLQIIERLLRELDAIRVSPDLYIYIG